MSDAADRGRPRGAPPFAAHEWMIAWRYMRARRREGGISVIVWYALVGVALAVGTLIVVMAVMVGFRAEFTDRILGAEGHVKFYAAPVRDANGNVIRSIEDYDAMTARVAEVPGVIRAAPMVEAQALVSKGSANAGALVRGERLEDLRDLPYVANPEEALGALDDLPRGIAIGWGVAQELGVDVGDRVSMILPGGQTTPFGTAPKVKGFEVVYIFRIGRTDVDKTRVYMTFEAAQDFFNRGDAADQVEAIVEDPQALGSRASRSEFDQRLAAAAGPRAIVWSWKDANGAFLSALDTERAVMFMILSLVVLIAALNIISGLVMLVKNKGRDIGILRTVGLTQGAILRVFFLCGAGIGTLGTLIGVGLGILFVIYIDPIFDVVNFFAGGGIWDPEIRMLTKFPAVLRWEDVASAAGLALALSWFITFFPARKAARLHPVEALRYE
ncbi:lipoprotein-releasing ABC transporter permease subunit [Albimonas pacifica]|uniref:Lipoprotein-releasing system permease protein n=1 Tax=Albimonas pacifica TaxID=1114924 RepID=A0A1I3I052_9RHOB|nr:lipoprotein-releasing ABC transporter permease subunit [Albimonas pacifica]SFI41210.1 lipoprotein-releasing system permease protein [Albimonas pacifica]